MINQRSKDNLCRNYELAMALAASSERLNLYPGDGNPPQRYVAEYSCKGLIRTDADQIIEADRFVVGIYLPEDFCRKPISGSEIVTWLSPSNVYHPNISDPRMLANIPNLSSTTNNLQTRPVVCMGHLAPSTDLVTILYMLYAIITWSNYAAEDPLNPMASQWRRNQPDDRFPIDKRGLKTSRVELPTEQSQGV